MPKLALNVLPVAGELPVSLASRLAQRNGSGLNEFLRDMGIRLADLIDGRPEAVARLAEISGQSARDLQWDTPSRTAGWVWFRGERFPSASFRKREIRGCRGCLAQSHALRAGWLYSHQHYCHEHGKPLQPLWSDPDLSRLYDVSSHPGPTKQSAEPRAPTSFDVWLNARLSGRSHAPIWLDWFALWAAVEFTLALGKTLAADEGHLGPRSDLIAAHQIFDLGFSACQSEETVLEALTRHQMAIGTPSVGQRRIFGPLYTLLGEGPIKEDLVPFKALLKRHIEATWPLGPGDEVIVEPVLDRSYFSAPTLAPLDSEEWRTLDEHDGGARSSGKSWSLIKAADLAERLGSQQAGVTASQFRQSLGMTSQLFDQLHEAGALNAARRGDGWDFFEGQRLLDDVLRGAEPLVRPRRHWRSLAQAAHELGVSQAVVLMRARAGDFLRIGCDIRCHGFARIMIDLTGADGQPVPLAAFARAQGLALADIEALARAGLVEASALQYPVRDLFASPKQVPAISREEMARFQRRFISRRSLGLAWRLSAAELALRCKTASVTPVFGTGEVFSRQDIAATES